MKDTGGPAFPFVFDDMATRSRQVYTGMSIRDYFAAKAMGGMCMGAPIPQKNELTQIANRSYEMADAMLKERSKQ